ncbi:membrane-spanning 4-domains subfamily A member 6A isoform X2 [Rhinolophus ferrumequinum]|uniref:Membrane spanning 4-domains A6A n=1 Tax=Rhinolophus ferrumequinum TaxID=59479 RepID=A0A671DW88_RHIFE|nr:membrane-spanning 4-domains subfamily A member 6A isoform X2 [Rhinolophus ferrumequinum]
MLSQPMTNETVVIVTSNRINLSQTENPKSTNQGQDILKKLKAEIKVLGTIQILCGVMVLSLGIILKSASFRPPFTQVFSPLLQAAYPFLGALCVHSSLAANILSSLSALVGFVLLSVNLATLSPALRMCYLNHENVPSEHHGFNYYDSITDDSSRSCPITISLLAGMLSMTMICTMLELGLAVLVAVIWWKQAHSDFPDSVRFLTLSHKNKSGIITKATIDSGYEELLTS